MQPRHELARARRLAAEEARKTALMQRRAAKDGVVGGGGDGGCDAAAEATPAPEAEVESADLRRDAARARRQAAEEARRAALLDKRAAKDRGSGGQGAGGDDAEVTRLQAALALVPEGAAHDATRTGLRKQLAARKAVAVRAQRQREMAQREAQREALRGVSREAQDAQQVVGHGPE